MTNAAKVAEIFSVAGSAFSKLGEMTMDLQKDEAKTNAARRWTDEEIQLLKESVQRFGQDIEKISQMIKTRTARQIKEAMKRRNLLSTPCIEETISFKNNEIKEKVEKELITTKSNDINKQQNLNNQSHSELIDELEKLNQTKNSQTGTDREHDIDIENDITVWNSKIDEFKNEDRDDKKRSNCTKDL